MYCAFCLHESFYSSGVSIFVYFPCPDQKCFQLVSTSQLCMGLFCIPIFVILSSKIPSSATRRRIFIIILRFSSCFHFININLTQLVSHCPRLTETRKDIFLDKIFGYDHTWSIRRLMEFIRLPVILSLIHI